MITRDSAIGVMRTVLVAPVTRTVRGIPTEVALGPDHGLAVECAASLDNLLAFPKSMLTRRLGRLDGAGMGRLCQAVRVATDC